MAKKNSKKTLSSTQVGIGVGLTAAAVAAAGAYFLGVSPNAKKNRAKVKSWMFRARAEVLEGLEKAEQMSEKEFNQLVETVSRTYSKLNDASIKDIANFKREMKAHWPKIVKEGKAAAATVAKVVHAKTKAKKEPVKKTAAKKSAKKTTAKAKKASAKKKK